MGSNVRHCQDGLEMHLEMKWFPELRALALLRRIARALEESNRMEQDRRERPRKTRLTEISTATVADFNERWHMDQQARGISESE